jgi:hypothetical protein
MLFDDGPSEKGLFTFYLEQAIHEDKLRSQQLP